MSTSDKAVRAIARRLTSISSDDPIEIDEFERTLRDMGVGQLIQAADDYVNGDADGAAYETALAKVLRGGKA